MPRLALHRLFISLIALAPAPMFGQQPARAIAITHVNVVDVVAGLIRADQTVVLANGQITALGPSASITGLAPLLPCSLVRIGPCLIHRPVSVSVEP